MSKAIGNTSTVQSSLKQQKHLNVKRKGIQQIVTEVIAVLMTVILFGVPLYFVFVNAAKTTQEASLLNMAWPSEFQLTENISAVLSTGNGMIVQAFMNSALITTFSIILLILFGSMAGYVLHRKTTKLSPFFNFLILVGLIIPPAVVPTIWVLEGIGLFKTMPGIILVEVALNLPFTIILYRSFMATIPKQIDEAALIDGCGRFQLFFKIILPLLKPVSATVIVLTAVGVYNDFVHPLYFFPGAENATVQLTLYNFLSMYGTEWNLLFTNILIISIPPLILFIFFNKQIVAGMTSGSVK